MLIYLLNGDLRLAVAWAFMVILAISVHEMAHAWMAYKRGDDTAAQMGRLTINPVVHFDPIGFLCVMFAPIGWGKPVPFNPYNLKDPKIDAMWIALAGPISNIIQALVLAVIYHAIATDFAISLLSRVEFGQALFDTTRLVCYVGVLLNLALAFFNMLPFFPLDGEKVLIGLLPLQQAIKVEEFRTHSTQVLMAIIMIGFLLPGGLSPLMWYINMTATPIRILLIGS